MAKLIKQTKHVFHLKRWLIVLGVVALAGAGAFAYSQWSHQQAEQKAAEKKAADERATKAAIDTENTRQLKELEAKKPTANASQEEKKNYASQVLDVSIRLKDYSQALTSFKQLEASVKVEKMTCVDLVNGAYAYAEQGDTERAKQLFKQAEVAAKNQTSDPIDYQLYIDYINEKRGEVL